MTPGALFIHELTKAIETHSDKKVTPDVKAARNYQSVTAKAANSDNFPSFSLAAWRESNRDTAVREKLAQSLTSTCHHSGFFLLKNHGIDPDLISKVFELSQRCFELPRKQREQMHKKHSRHFRGWESEGSEYTNGRPDIREQIDLWSEHPARSQNVEPHYLRLLGPNQWPSQTELADFRPTLERWFSELGGVADELMQVLSSGLGLPENYFDKAFGNERMSLTKLIRYPKTPAGAFGVNAHHDAGFLTLLSPGTTPGLQIEQADGSWLEVPVVKNSLVVNLGEILQSMTGNYLLATPHRVVTNQPRQSAAYFHGPSLDMPLEPIALDAKFAAAVADSPRHKNAGFMARKEETEAGTGDMQSLHRPAVYGEQIWNYFSRSYPDIVEKHYPQ